MEIALLPNNALKVKGKQALLLVNPDSAAVDHHASLYFQYSDGQKTVAGGVPIVGPGEYEIGGIKISGMKNKDGNAFSVRADDVEILLGDLAVVEKLQQKLKEHQVVVIRVNEDRDASFINGLATNVVILYGEKAKDVMQKFAKEGTQELNKFQTTKDKLPQEIQTILLT